MGVGVVCQFAAEGVQVGREVTYSSLCGQPSSEERLDYSHGKTEFYFPARVTDE